MKERDTSSPALRSLTIFLRLFVQSDEMLRELSADVSCISTASCSCLSSVLPRHARSHSTWAVVLNASLNNNFRTGANDARATFESDADRKDEHVIFTRSKFSF